MLEEDLELINAIRSDDPMERSRALDVLYQRCYPRIKSFVLSNTGSETDVKDIFQEGMTAFYENVYWGNFKGNSAVGTYIFSICRNRWLQQLKKLKRHDNLLAEMKLTGTESGKTIDTSLLDDVFGELKEDCQKLLIEFYYKKKSIRELQTTLKMKSEQVVKNKKGRCLQYLMNIAKSKKLNFDSFFDE